MPLYERLMGLERPRIPVHRFQSMMAERSRGKVTDTHLSLAFGLSASEMADVATLQSRLTAVLTPLVADDLTDVLLLAEACTPPYDTVAAVKTRLGV